MLSIDSQLASMYTTFLSSYVQWCLAIFIGSIDIRSVFDQKLADFVSAILRGIVPNMKIFSSIYCLLWLFPHPFLSSNVLIKQYTMPYNGVRPEIIYKACLKFLLR